MPGKDRTLNRKPRSARAGSIGFIGTLAGVVLLALVAACVASLPWALARGPDGAARYNAGRSAEGRVPPWWAAPSAEQRARLNARLDERLIDEAAASEGLGREEAIRANDGAAAASLRKHWPRFLLGSDELGRSVLIRCLTGGGISLTVGTAAALLSVLIGTLYGAIAGYAGGRTDAVMMRIVDVLYGLPTILLVVLLAVAGDSLVDEHVTRAKERAGIVQREAEREVEREAMSRRVVVDRSETRGAAKSLLSNDAALRTRLEQDAMKQAPPRSVSAGARTALDLTTLLIAVGGVSWLTMSRVIRGQVLSLKSRPFIEAARAIGASPARIFAKHLLPNLAGPIIVYATLTVPQAILQEAFLSFLGIGVKPPMPSWGNLVAEGLPELNPYESNWWLLVFPCVLLAGTLLALNIVGERLRERWDPRSS